MSFLRVVTFDGDAMTDDQFEEWDATIGEHLRTSPDCIRAKAASSGGTTLVVSEWVSEDAYRAEMASPAYEAALRDVTTKLGLPPDIEPSFMFEGDVKVNIS